MQEILFSKPKLHLFVCVNDRTKTNDTKPSCSPQITSDMIKEVKQWVREQGWTSSVYVTKTQCLGFCNPDRGVACIYPQGKFVKGIQNIDDLKLLIIENRKNI